MKDSSRLEIHLSVYTHEYMVLKTCRHGTLLFNQPDTFVGRSLDLYGEWCEAEIDLLAQVLKPGDVVLDVGANIGCHTVPFAKLVGETGRVVAFEPQRLVFQNLCANLALNALRNVETNAFCSPTLPKSAVQIRRNLTTL